MTQALVFGAGGCLGIRLVSRLGAKGIRVRIALPHLERFDRPGESPDVEAVAADALDTRSLAVALQGVDVAWYLTPSTPAAGRFAPRDLAAAENFRTAAASAGVSRIVCLGDLPAAALPASDRGAESSPAAVLRAGPVAVTELRAGPIIGPDSPAVRSLRDLVSTGPVVATTRQLRARSQPIALDNLVAYLAGVPEFSAAAATPLRKSRLPGRPVI